MNLPRRAFLQLAVGAAGLPARSCLAQALAQGYPSRPVRLVVAFPAGGSIDLIARIMGQWLSERLGQQFIIDNRPGAGGNVGTGFVVRSAPDGYTLLVAAANNGVNATLYDDLAFNFVRDIAPVASIVRVPQVMEVNPSFPTKTISEFIAYAKTNPGKIDVATGPKGTGPYMAAELLKMAGVDIVNVPYRGAGSMLTDLLGGQVRVAFDNMPSSIEHIRAGKLRALAVTTAMRSGALPEVPAISEFLPGYEAGAWFGIAAPMNTPIQIINKLNVEINIALVDPVVKRRLDDLGGTVVAGSPADFGNLIVAETEKWAKVIKFGGLKPE